MPAHKGFRANAEEINRLISERGGISKKFIDASRRKTLDRARKGHRMKLESLEHLAQVFGVEVSQITIPDEGPLPYQRLVSIKLVRTESLKGFPRGSFEGTDIAVTDLLDPITVEAKFEVDDPTEDQAETAARLVESVEALIKPQEASSMIRAKGRLNSSIKKLGDLGIYLYVGSYKKRIGALPFIDADQSEIVSTVISNRLLLIFSESRKSRTLQRQVDQGMSLDGLEEEREWLSELLEKERRNELDDEDLRFLSKLREKAKHVFIDLKI